MGIAEYFATITSDEYAYFTAPRSAQTLSMSLHFCSVFIIFSTSTNDLTFSVDDYLRKTVELLTIHFSDAAGNSGGSTHISAFSLGFNCWSSLSGLFWKESSGLSGSMRNIRYKYQLQAAEEVYHISMK